MCPESSGCGGFAIAEPGRDGEHQPEERACCKGGVERGGVMKQSHKLRSSPLGAACHLSSYTHGWARAPAAPCFCRGGSKGCLAFREAGTRRPAAGFHKPS